VNVDLTGHTAFVTGGARGIGYACAGMLKHAGASVVIADRDAAAMEEAARNLGCFGVSVDVGDENSVQTAYEEALSKAGPVDILVNCAGVLQRTLPPTG
jgi:NAD(P)-dependent dehydrogenase (short-subunit alcohol dehydrogenase family)